MCVCMCVSRVVKTKISISPYHLEGFGHLVSISNRMSIFLRYFSLSSNRVRHNLSLQEEFAAMNINVKNECMTIR